MTTNPLRAARGTTAALATRALKDGELAKNTDTERLHIGDATTLGGLPVALLSDVQELVPEDYGAVGDGATDDTTALTNWLNAVMASENRVGVLPKKTYAISGALPTINAGGVQIIGVGPSTSHDVGSAFGTIIKAIGSTTGYTMLTVAPTEGASAQRLDSVSIKGVTFDCNSKAAKGLVMKSTIRGDLDIAVLEATTAGLEFGVVTTLGEARDTQRVHVRFVGRQLLNAAPALHIKGDATANTSFMPFEFVDIIHADAVGIISESSDNNSWGDVRIIRSGGGSASYCWEMRGGATGSETCRTELIYQLSSTVPLIAKGTGTYTIGAGYKGANDPSPIEIHYLDVGNGTPLPTVEAGASVHVHGIKGTDAPSATTTDLARYAAAFTDITGTTTIAGFGYVPAGHIRDVRFTGILTLTHNATSLILPGGADIVTAAGDTARLVSLGSGNWQMLVFTRKSQRPYVLASASEASDATNDDVALSPKGLADAGAVRLLFRLTAADMNSTSDQVFTKLGTFTDWLIVTVRVGNSSASCASAVGGIYTGAGKTGVNITNASQTFTNVNAAAKGSGIGTANTADVTLTATPILSLTTPHGSAATLDHFIYGVALN